MQLILNTETDIGIQKKMSAIEHESFEEKFINKTLAEKVDDEIPNIKDELVKEEIVEDCDKNDDEEEDINDSKTNNDENVSKENLNDSSKDQIENNSDTVLPVECKQEKSDEVSDIKTETYEPEEIKSDENMCEVDEVKHEEEEQTDKQSKEDENEFKNLNGDKQDKEENVIKTENTIEDKRSEELDINLQESHNDDFVKTEIRVEKESEKNVDVTSGVLENGEVISIPDEKEEESITMIDQEMADVEKQLETSINTDSKLSPDSSTDKKVDDENKEHICIEKNIEPEIKIESPSKETILVSDEVKLSDEVVKDTNETSAKCNEQSSNIKEEPEKKLNTNNNVKETKKFSVFCKLSNTLDILSDEEEEPTQKELQKELSSVEKQCINIEDDDDIMLIDEDTNVKDVKKNTENSVETKVEDKECKESPHVNTVNIEAAEEKDTSDVSKDSTNITETNVQKPKEEEKSTESKTILRPLLPVNFLKTCKKNLADMTRDELEEFCILKIVESVVDRSNLSEIKSQLKTMGQNIEEYKKKAMMLTKQNRDLQVVLKSVQEEQKKKSDVPITPLKITRSVGMQVFMTDKTQVRRKSSLIPNNSQNNTNPNNTPNRVNKSQPNHTPKSQKPPINTNNTQQIPVPRLVPAVNNANNNKLQAPTSVAPKTPISANLPNGIKNSPPIQKPEKRPHSKIQQGNSVTVDLTDDEPPTKVLQRNVNPPVRLVSPQNLLAPQRQPFATTVNSPRKVYIPISGSQNQVRPGQTIMLKPIPPPGTRPRLPSILPKTSGKAVTMTRITNRHPAPLPDSMKQYQPPNWKALPPAPELKLSKVENGIVISWKIDGYQEDNHEEIASYQLYAYQETSSPPSTALWKKIGDVKALPLPMACTLTQFMAGYKYYFAVRAVDIRSRLGPFSAPGSILLLNKM